MIRVGAVFPSSSSTVFSFPMFVRTLQGSSSPPTSDDFGKHDRTTCSNNIFGTDPTDSGNGSTDNGTDGSGDRSAASSPPLPTAAPIVNNNTFESATSAAAPLIASPAASAQSAAFDASKALALQATLRDLQQVFFFFLIDYMIWLKRILFVRSIDSTAKPSSRNFRFSTKQNCPLWRTRSRK